MVCPGCGNQLTLGRSPQGEFWACSNCGGRAATIALLRRLLTRDYVKSFWARAVETETASGRKCPSCGGAMIVAPGDASTLDLCKRCQLVWFDANEFESAPKVVTPVQETTVPQEALESIARTEARTIIREWRRRYPQGDLPDVLPYIPALLGVPIEEEQEDLRTWPWISWALIFVLIVTGAAGFLDPDLVQRFGFIPSEPFRLGGLTLITSFFLHASVFQLLANAYFLLIFGDNVEDFLGRWSFALLLVVATLGGEALHGLLAHARHEPYVGASAAISGIVVFYSLKFPHRKLRYFKLFRWFVMPASAALGFWAFSQILAARAQVTGTADVSALGPIGGALVGVWFLIMWRQVDPVFGDPEAR